MANWKRLSNSDSIWEEGAFNRNSMDHPDYGWGVYNAITHDVVGDSVYIISLANGAKKKLWIKSKNSINNTYVFTYADLDGTNEFTETLDVTPYEDKLFVYYNLSIGSVIDREPAQSSWDLLFSRYSATVYDLDGTLLLMLWWCFKQFRGVGQYTLSGSGKLPRLEFKTFAGC